MGTGKTTVGRQLAKRLQRRFLDSDHEIEARTGVRIPVIFEIEGEEGFRKRESQVLAKLTGMSDLVLATGGGAVLAEENRRCMRDSGVVIYLHSPPEVLYERTRYDRNRPLLQVADPLGALRNLYELRDPLYRAVAHLVIDSTNGPSAQLAERIEGELRTLCEP
ncbi:MAG: shikimate kinase [Gammaproteobacteria bacterium]|nr:shikimate kinase [Gammaproteobacteria bacterium]MBU1414401.1 shikimate kinase [Gammaproteobacteria bacterium]